MRAGTFSSSGISKLIKTGKGPEGFGAPAITYIGEVQKELRLGRALGNEVSSRPTSWGLMVESRAFAHLGLEYSLESKIRYYHPLIKFWSGMPDTLKEVKKKKTVGDIKCPFTLKSFCEAVDAMEVGWEEFKKVKPEWYWQIISNAILTGSTRGEIIVYAPYQDELKEIRKDTEMFDGNQNKVAWINWAEDEDLPYLIEGNHYKNVNILEWDLSIDDMDHLTERVKTALALL